MPIGKDTGLAAIRRGRRGRRAGRRRAGGQRSPSATCSTATPSTCAALVDLSGSRPLRVVVDAGNGMAGLHRARRAGRRCAFDVVPMYFELDGTFPNHEANPLDPANLVDLQARVVAEGADIGLAFDGDADRCFVVDELGEPVSPSAVTALVGRPRAGQGAGRAVIHNLITSRAVPELVAEHGRHAGPHPRRPLVHQGDDGRDRCGLRRRALGALLLPRLLERRLRACSPRCTCWPRSASRTARCRS